MAFGSDRYYRRMALRKAGLKPGMKLLDVATGTGLVARAALPSAKLSAPATFSAMSVWMLIASPGARSYFSDHCSTPSLPQRLTTPTTTRSRA